MRKLVLSVLLMLSVNVYADNYGLTDVNSVHEEKQRMCQADSFSEC